MTDKEYEKHYVYHEYEIYTHVMIIIVDVRTTNTLNKIATYLAGRPVHGTVFIAMYRKPEYDEHPPYVSITQDILKQILSIRKKCTSLTTGVQRSDKEYINFEKLLELEINKHKELEDVDISKITGDSLNAK
jgi:hypothetical protein